MFSFPWKSTVECNRISVLYDYCAYIDLYMDRQWEWVVALRWNADYICIIFGPKGAVLAIMYIDRLYLKKRRWISSPLVFHYLTLS